MSKIPPRSDAKQMFRQEMSPSKYFIMPDSQDTVLLNPSSTGLISYFRQNSFPLSFPVHRVDVCAQVLNLPWRAGIALTKDDHFTKDSDIHHVLISTDLVDQLCSTFGGCGVCSGGDARAEMQIDIFSHMYFGELCTQ